MNGREEEGGEDVIMGRKGGGGREGEEMFLDLLHVCIPSEGRSGRWTGLKLERPVEYFRQLSSLDGRSTATGGGGCF